MSYLGDFTPGKTVRRFFNTRKADGTPITLAGTPVVSIYKDGGTTESTAGVTRTLDFDGRTGLHLVVIDTSADGTFYAAGSDFELAITAGTVDGVSVVGTSLGKFSLANRSIAVDASGRVDVGYVGGVTATLDAEFILARGAVATGTSGTSFTATIAGSTLSAISGAYTSKQKLIFQSGSLASQGRPITGYTVSGGTATFDFTGNPFTGAPGAGDTFAIG
jgi:hypothetical protein